MPPILDRLFELLSGRADARSVPAEEWPALLAMAVAHAVQPLLAQRVLAGASRDAIPPGVQAELRAVQEETTHRNMRRLRDFAAAATALQARGIPAIALKGMQLAPLVYRSLAARAMRDLDLLVPATSLTEAAEAMRELGYAPAQPYRVSSGAVPYFMHHVPPFVRHGLSTIEVHWHITPPPSSVAIEELWQRAVPARIAGVDTHVLSTEDLLLHLAVHATYNSRCVVSVRACCDIAEVVRTQNVDWDAAIDRARRWNVGAGTYLVLRLARELLDAPIPVDVLNALAPPDFDERLLQIALRGEADTHRAGRLRHAGGAVAKLRAVKELFFVRRHELADANNVERSSPLVYGLYIRRAAKLLKRLPEVVAAYRDDGRVAAESAVLDHFLRSSR